MVVKHVSCLLLELVHGCVFLRFCRAGYPWVTSKCIGTAYLAAGTIASRNNMEISPGRTVVDRICSVHNCTATLPISLVKDRDPFYPLVSKDAHPQDILPLVVRPDTRPLSPLNYEPPARLDRQRPPPSLNRTAAAHAFSYTAIARSLLANTDKDSRCNPIHRNV